MLSLSTLIPLFLFALVSSATPGPNNVMLMSSGMNFGFSASLPHMSGVIFGFPIMIMLVGLGLMQVFELVPHSLLVLKLISLCYLLYLAWRIATTSTLNTGESTGRPLRFVQAALFQWVNPKAWAMALTAISLYTPESRPLSSVFIVALTFVASGIISSSTWTLLGHELKRFLTDSMKLRIVNIAMAVLLVASLLPVFFQTTMS